MSLSDKEFKKLLFSEQIEYAKNIYIEKAKCEDINLEALKSFTIFIPSWWFSDKEENEARNVYDIYGLLFHNNSRYCIYTIILYIIEKYTYMPIFNSKDYNYLLKKYDDIELYENIKECLLSWQKINKLFFQNMFYSEIYEDLPIFIGISNNLLHRLFEMHTIFNLKRKVQEQLLNVVNSRNLVSKNRYPFDYNLYITIKASEMVSALLQSTN